MKAFAARLVREQHVLDIPLELGRGALVAWLELSAEISAFFAAKRDQPPAEGLLLALISHEAGGEILCRYGVRQARCIERRLGDARPHMGSRHESSVPQKRHASKDDLRRLEIEDRLKERLRAGKNLGDLRRNERAGRRLDRPHDLRPDQRRRDGAAVMPAARVGAKVNQGIGVCRPVPDDVVGAAADLRLVVAARNGVGQNSSPSGKQKV